LRLAAGIVSAVSVGANVRRLREAAEPRVTQEDLSHAAGISTSTLGRIERGTYEPRLPTLRKLAQALGVPVADLLDADD
jgi:transcriptional regulator with XRE-family HTH domain